MDTDPARTSPAPPAPQPPATYKRLLGAAGLYVLVAALLLGGIMLIDEFWFRWPVAFGGVLVVLAISVPLAYLLQPLLVRSAVETADELTGLIIDKLKEADLADPEMPGAHELFLRRRFQEPLVSYSYGAPWNARIFNIVTLGAIVAALGTSGVAAAAGDARGGRWVVFGLGIVGGAFSAVNQLWNPQRRATVRYRAANSLRREAWDLVLASEKYDLPFADAYGKFVLEVKRIVSEVEATTEMTDVTQNVTAFAATDDGDTKPSPGSLGSVNR